MADSVNPYDDEDIQPNTNSDLRSVNESANDIRWEHSNLQKDKTKDEE